MKERKDRLLEQAARCRRLAEAITDAAATASLLELAKDYERRAKAIDDSSDDKSG